MRRINGIWPPSKTPGRRPTGKLALALVAAAGGLAVAGAGAAADALPLLVLVNAAMDVVEVHVQRNSPQPLDFLPGAQLLRGVDRGFDQVDRIGRAEALVRMSWMPAASQTARTAAPAITPVPGLAGTRITSRRAEVALAPYAGSCCLPAALSIMLREPSLTAFSTPAALRWPCRSPSRLCRGRRRRRPCREAEPAAAFDHRGAAPDLDDLVDQFAVANRSVLMPRRDPRFARFLGQYMVV